jgi:hypothetical protein
MSVGGLRMVDRALELLSKRTRPAKAYRRERLATLPQAAQSEAHRLFDEMRVA